MTKRASFAYAQDVKRYDKGDDNVSLDLIASGVSSVRLSDKKNLRAFRASFCRALASVKFSNMPNLEVIDLRNSRNLTKLKIKRCPKLRTLDLTKTAVTDVKHIEHIECLLTTKPLKILLEQPFPRLALLDCCAEIPNLNPLHFPKLEVLRCCLTSKSVKLSELSSFPSLCVADVRVVVVPDSVADNSKLRVIGAQDADGSGASGELLRNSGIYVSSLIHGELGAPFNPQMMDGLSCVESLKLLWGPWGVPSVDQDPYPAVKPCVVPPPGCDLETARDAVAGAIFGSAVGDMLGLGTEFLTEPQANVSLMGPLNMTWSQSTIHRHTMRFVRGSPTDDTSQNILIMRSLVHANSGNLAAVDNVSVFETHGVRVDVADFGSRLLEWIWKGHAEHSQNGGLGIGQTTLRVADHPSFSTDPIGVARKVWEDFGRTAAPNGSVMRIASSGCFAFWDEEVVKLVSDKYGRATHADPRCAYCAVGAGLIISRIIQQRTGLRQEFDLDETLKEVYSYVPDSLEYQDVIEQHIHAKTLEELELSGNTSIGYCLKAFGSAVWALRYCTSFDQGMEAICRKAGDADTNAAVVCAFLGAKYGFSGLSKEFLELMFVGQWLWRETKSFMNLMGLEPPPSPWQ